jgi:cytochrome c oxidase assembly protein subunit 15
MAVIIIVTGGAVRLTGSGLGCSTWPECGPDSLYATPAMGINGAIEFGNRMVTFLLAAVAIATFLVALRSGRRSLVKLSLVLGLGVPAQAVIGGITVLTDLNPWVVAFHLLVSLAMIGVAVALLRRVGEGDGPAAPTVPRALVHLARLTFLAGWAVLYVGTVVTGSGPHAGDLTAPRNGLDPRSVSQLHTDLVFLLLGLTVGLVLALRAASAPRPAQRAARALLAVELGQGVVGFVQYFTGLPIVLVAVHLLGAALTSASLAWVLVRLRERSEHTEPYRQAPRPGNDASSVTPGAARPVTPGRG